MIWGWRVGAAGCILGHILCVESYHGIRDFPNCGFAVDFSFGTFLKIAPALKSSTLLSKEIFSFLKAFGKFWHGMHNVACSNFEEGVSIFVDIAPCFWRLYGWIAEGVHPRAGVKVNKYFTSKEPKLWDVLVISYYQSARRFCGDGDSSDPGFCAFKWAIVLPFWDFYSAPNNKRNRL